MQEAHLEKSKAVGGGLGREERGANTEESLSLKGSSRLQML